MQPPVLAKQSVKQLCRCNYVIVSPLSLTHSNFLKFLFNRVTTHWGCISHPLCCLDALISMGSVGSLSYQELFRVYISFHVADYKCNTQVSTAISLSICITARYVSCRPVCVSRPLITLPPAPNHVCVFRLNVYRTL